MTRKQEIILTAKTLFREHGYKSVSMRDLAQKMNIKAASLYNHISSKEEILAEIILGVAQYFTKEMKTVKARQDNTQQQLENIIAHHINLTVKSPESIAILNNDWMHLEGKHYEYYMTMRMTYEDDLRSIIKTGIERGELKPQNIEIILFSLLSTLRTLHLWYRKQGDLNEKSLNTEISEILLYGIVSSR